MRRFCLRPAVLMVAVAGSVLASNVTEAGQAFEQEEPGGAFVAVGGEATQGVGAIYRVTRDGHRFLFSDYANPQQGPLGSKPFSVQIESDASLLAVDIAAGTGGRSAIFRLDRRTGFRTLLSDFGNPAQGPLGFFPENLSLDSRGEIFVATGEKQANPPLVFRVDPVTGNRVIVSDFSNPAQGPLGVALERVFPEPWDEDHLLVIDRDFGPNKDGALFRVDRFTGKRTIVSDFNDASQGPLGVNPEEFVFEPDRHIVVNSENEDDSQLLRVDVRTGFRTLVSSLGDASQGPTVEEAEGLARQSNGVLLSVDVEGGTNHDGAILRVDPVTGQRTLWTDFGDSSQGPVAAGPVDLAAITDRDVRPHRPW